MDSRMADRDAFQIIGVKKTIQFDEEFDRVKEIHRFWSQLNQNGTLDRLIGLNNGEIKGLIGATANVREAARRMDYWVAVEFKGNAPEDFAALEVPPSKWAVFQVGGVVRETVPDAWAKIYSKWLPVSGHQLAGGPSLEVYKTSDPYSSTAETELWISVKQS